MAFPYFKARDRRTQFTIIESNFIYFVTPERRVSEISENYKSQRDLQQIQYTRSVPDFLEIKKIIKRIRFSMHQSFLCKCKSCVFEKIQTT
ncbi:unnamed protein product [Rhizophagus irregularis]|nr:unnamed protein product [Rhizophagus irregularis]